MAAGRESGLPVTEDFNGPAPEGLGYFDSNRLHGKRQSTAVAFLQPAMRRGNLRVETGAAAARILFEARRALGVEYLQRGKTVRAPKHVSTIDRVAANQIGDVHPLTGLRHDVVIRRVG
jgi:choline dehydrogenase